VEREEERDAARRGVGWDEESKSRGLECNGAALVQRLVVGH
jgi:hypothetical protein